ncbi:MAG TPA: thioredoxin family protein [Oligoflexia bacterium]|nr:thioredoxin family protein [Oligoflexia bacterium]HMP27938.1 thioredoxin family protein [Oligoflexia bacterium]
MNNLAGPYDLRANLWRTAFYKAFDYGQFIAGGSPAEQARWHKHLEKIIVPIETNKRFQNFKRELNILVLAGTWCGDCARQAPMIHKLETLAPEKIKARFLDNQADPEIRDELRLCGGARVPVAIAMTEDFFELGRFGDRSLAYYRNKIKNETEGAICESGISLPTAEELTSELIEWAEFIERCQLIARLSPFLRNRWKD